ncbi:hypothetical protein FPQ18DRAFT_375189 [Pyronema domesticum]|uniref:Uncharacterized protein n=1 Tax=Pyronema omphalodes (strain CBS 100304) TaxID=1076935 RepID=U4LTE3_PYROM|nr:hypothetical protein FPQ18DRAFT_375189 [Pyronema domesticum]CCX30756.1 Similar to hypothetical protein NEUTE2DRAFT_100572 [Neurospora tetrasperma FGSC 2509]; acc. no. EGZ77539 [Pyronema omphalodes CBS 100304]
MAQNPEQSTTPSSSPPPSKKRTYSDTIPQGEVALATASSSATERPGQSSSATPPARNEREGSTDTLLQPLPPFDWTAFLGNCTSEQASVSAEEKELLEEYHSWVWLYELWVTCRSKDQNVRLNREMATIVRWMQLEEQKIEKTRQQHAEVAQKISMVLGLTGLLGGVGRSGGVGGLGGAGAAGKKA